VVDDIFADLFGFGCLSQNPKCVLICGCLGFFCPHGTCLGDTCDQAYSLESGEGNPPQSCTSSITTSVCGVDCFGSSCATSCATYVGCAATGAAATSTYALQTAYVMPTEVPLPPTIGDEDDYYAELSSVVSSVLSSLSASPAATTTASTASSVPTLSETCQFTAFNGISTDGEALTGFLCFYENDAESGIMEGIYQEGAIYPLDSGTWALFPAYYTGLLNPMAVSLQRAYYLLHGIGMLTLWQWYPEFDGTFQGCAVSYDGIETMGTVGDGFCLTDNGEAPLSCTSCTVTFPCESGLFTS